MPQGYIRPPRVLFSILYQLSMARQAGEDVGSFGGLAYLKTIPIWGCQQKKPSLRKRMADLQLLCSLHTAPYCCCSFFQVCTLGRFSKKIVYSIFGTALPESAKVISIIHNFVGILKKFTEDKKPEIINQNGF